MKIPKDSDDAFNGKYDTELDLNVAELRSALRNKAYEAGYSPDLFDAIALVESGWKLDAINKTGADGKYGGSYGPMQILRSNLTKMKFNPDTVCANPTYAAAAAVAYFKTCPVKLTRLKDFVAYWNAGRVNFDTLSNGNSCRTTYYPRILEALDYILVNPPGRGDDD